jgi:hypothetical protein
MRAETIPNPAVLARSQSVEAEGIAAGTIGAVVVAAWFLLLDGIAGRPLYTPTVLGMALFHGGQGLHEPGTLGVSLETAAMFTWVHVLLFAFGGGAAARLIALAEENPNWGFGILLLLIAFLFGFIAVTALFAAPVLHALTVPAILVGNLLAAAAMATYFRRRHPGLKILP